MIMLVLNLRLEPSSLFPPSLTPSLPPSLLTSLGLGHTSSHYPHADFRDELDRDLARGIGVLEVVDQLKGGRGGGREGGRGVT